eukprot:TRINITY_DN476_c1_g1_i1.p1 TRINITY_DN476_c1_g1~~TRINITY_DN476_c1_g1_i1.p1  ORF type:complete len:703 (+),score=314.31 TRINITY_DN476_c1_g1_i1:89-2110(+)
MENTDLNVLASETVSKLSEIWNEMGIDQENRNSLLKRLAEDVAFVYNESLKRESEHRDDLKMKIISSVDSAKKISLQLGQTFNLSKDFEKSSLLVQMDMISTLRDEVEQVYEDRIIAVEQFHQQLNGLWEDLGFSIAEKDPEGKFSVDSNEDLTLSHIQSCERLVKSASKEKQERWEETEEISTEIRRVWKEMNEEKGEINNSTDSLISSSRIPLDLETLNSLRVRRDEWNRKKNEREEEISKIALKIATLWEQLSISEEERSAFFQTHHGLGKEVVKACESELIRMEELRRKSMEGLIMESRAKVEVLWDEMQYGEEDRTHYSNVLFCDEFTEENLDRLELEIKLLEEKAEKMRPILSLIQKREDLLKEKEEFLAISSDPARLLSKKRDPGRLLREEKMRKVIEKELPKMEKKLKESLLEWSNENQTDFLWNGTPYITKLLDAPESSEKQTPRKTLNTSISSTPSSTSLGKRTLDSGSVQSTPKRAAAANPLGSTTTCFTPLSGSKTLGRNGLNRTVNLGTPKSAQKSATVSGVTGRSLANKLKETDSKENTLHKFTPSKANSASLALNSTLPLPLPKTPEGNSRNILNLSLNSTSMSPLAMSPAKSSSSSTTESAKKRPFGVTDLNSPNKEKMERAKKSLKNLGIGSPLASEVASISSTPSRIPKMKAGSK